MRLIENHPTVAFRDCTHCQKYQYNESTGEVTLWHGKPLERVAGVGPPCRGPKGCPKGTPENPISLSPRNLRALLHYEQCRATGNFPDDPIVARNAAIFRGIEDEAEKIHFAEISALATASLTRGLR